jgi:hypothetical protein
MATTGSYTQNLSFLFLYSIIYLLWQYDPLTLNCHYFRNFLGNMLLTYVVVGWNTTDRKYCKWIHFLSWNDQTSCTLYLIDHVLFIMHT